MMKVVFISLVFLKISTVNAFAYLDPGSAGIIQMLLAALAAAAASITIYWNKLKSFIKKIFNIKDKKENKDSNQD